MFSHNPKRFVLTAIAGAAIAGAALLPSVASADGGTRPRPNGIWVPQGSPIIGTTYGGSGQLGVTQGTAPFGGPVRVVDAADYVI